MWERRIGVFISVHIYNNKKWYRQHSDFNHFRFKQNKDSTKLKFYCMDKVYKYWRGSYMCKQMSQNEI